MEKYYLFITCHTGAESSQTEFCDVFTSFDAAKERLKKMVEAHKFVEGGDDVKEVYSYDCDSNTHEVPLFDSKWRFYTPLFGITVVNERSGVKSERFIISVDANDAPKAAVNSCSDTLSMIWAAVQDKSMNKDEFYEHVKTLVMENFSQI